ncbi:hypothetical protein NHF46_22320 [Arthrobacter alpinus]|uniref:Uncharacterized protein n=1 Tax=Arthrobacter alpinus TaxID=656366 RepID=A0A0S2LVS1_9MICC|nr:hypothetical protein [Arthrobacter alpinus]ALO65534.1 hypothetical protein AS189_02265 [Arthrobacter alpinus]MDD0859700.1 hypothetical protein [Arthrobacter alpinus]
MGSEEPKNPKSANSIKLPLGFSAALALIAGILTLVFSSGGTQYGLRWDLAGIAVGIAFVAALLISSLLVMGHKENDASLSEGSGVYRKSSDRLAQAAEAARKSAEAKNSSEASGEESAQ